MKAILLTVVLLLAATPAWSESAGVTYVTSRNFYVDAGASAGLQVGAEVEVLRDGVVIGGARVIEVSARRAVCAWSGQDLVPVVGDAIRFAPTEAPSVQAPAETRGSWFDRYGLHGRLGLQTLHIRDRSGHGLDLDRPALALRLRGRRIGGSPLGTEVDVRASAVRWSRDGDGDTRSRSRVYRLSLFSGDPGAGWSWNAGRQFAPSLSVVHLFDGVRVAYAGRGWTAGVLGGTQPDPDLRVATETVEAGGWFTLRGAASSARWSLTAATVASRTEGDLDREFAWLQGRWSRNGFTLRADQVLDLNRGWKKDAGEPSISSTSTFLVTSWRANSRLDLSAGLDSRRRVRLYRDRETPETAFDDSYRQGYWLGARIRATSWLDLGLRGRSRLREGRERADSGTLKVGLRLARWGGWRASLRSTLYRSEYVEGWLQRARISTELHPRVTLGAFGGVRHEAGRANDLMDGTDPWAGAECEFTIRRNTWLSLRWETRFTGEEAFDQFWAGTGIRF